MNKNESRKLTKKDLEFAHTAINGGKEHGKIVEPELQEDLVNSLEGKDAVTVQQIIINLACTLNAVELMAIMETFKPLIAMRAMMDLKEVFLSDTKEETEEEKKR